MHMKTPSNKKFTVEHLRPSAVVIVLRLLAVLFLFDTVYAFIIFVFFGLGDSQLLHSSFVVVLWLLHTIKYILVTVIVIRLFANWAGRAYYLSGHHLVERLGLVNTTETTYELSQLKSIALSQNWLGRRFNYATFVLKFSGSNTSSNVILRDINNPSRYLDILNEHLKARGSEQ